MSKYTREEILELIEENGGPQGLDLSGKDLSGIDLSREAIEAEMGKVRERASDETVVWYSERTGSINLLGADLWHANLQGADLDHANLQDTRLGYANLQGANLVGTNLQGANLWGADLRGADLYLANFQGADLRFASLEGADLRFAGLQEANLICANLQGADLVDANLEETKSDWANLQGARLWGAKLQGARLWGAKLRAHLNGADLRGADLRSADFQGAVLTDANLQAAYLVRSHLEKVDLFGAKSLEGAYFYNAFLDDTRLKKEQLGGAIGEELESRCVEAREAYLALKNNFAEIGRYDDAAWAYRKERRMEKMCSAPWQARRFYGESQLGDSEESRLPAWHPRVLWFYTRTR